MGHRFRLLWWWMAYLGNGPRSFCRFWCCTKYCISIFSVDCEDCSISSKGLFTILVDIMVIWIKFIHFCLKLPWWLRWKNIYLQCGRPGLDPWVGKILWRRKWQPTLAWKVLWTEEPGMLQSMGSQRVGHNWVASLLLSLFIPVHFSSLIPKMLIFLLAISCLTTSNFPWFMDLTFQVPMKYCSL